MIFILRNSTILFITLFLVVSIHFRIAIGDRTENAQQPNSIVPKIEEDGLETSSFTKTAATKDDRTLASLGNTNEIGSLIMENINNLLTGTNLKDKQSLIQFPTKKPKEDNKDKFDGQGVVNSIEAIKDDLDKLSNSFNIFKIIDTFIEQWRNSLPLIATRHFTWLQAALLCAVGSLAVGAAIIAAEAFYFKTQRDNEEYAKLQKEHHQQQHYVAKLPSLTYGRRNYEEPQSLATAIVTMSPAALEKYYNDQWKRMNKPQSLKRNQRRRQRKNKNTAGTFWSKPKPAAAGASSKRIRRQITEPMIEPQLETFVGDFPSGSTWRNSSPNSFNQFEEYNSNKNSSENSNKTYGYWTRSNYSKKYITTTPINTEPSQPPLTAAPAIVMATQRQPAIYQEGTNQQQYYQYAPLPTLPPPQPRPPLLRRTEAIPENPEKPTAATNILAFFRNSVTKLLNFIIDGNSNTSKTGQASQGPYFLPAGPLKAGLSVPGLNQNRNIINF